MANEVFDYMIFGMHHLNITQAGSSYTGKGSYSHPSWELDLGGEDTGIDYWYNKMPNTYMKCLGKWGTSGTYFFGTADSKGNQKKVYCADKKFRVITLAMTHSSRNFVIGRLYKPGEVIYTEGTKGFAQGNHIHFEVAEGWQTSKVKNSKGYYNVKNIMDARKVVWIYTPYTTVISTAGLSFGKTSTLTYSQPKSGSSSVSTVKSSAHNNMGLYYKAHIGSIGWQKEVHDGAVAGTTGKSKAIEALYIDTRLLGDKLKLNIKVHMADIGWKNYNSVQHNTLLGSTGEGRPIEAIQIDCAVNKTGKKLKYQVHIENKGWMSAVSAGEIAGTTGQSLQIEAIKIWLE